ncbi:MAG TPA: DUF4388 domain-containing protein [Vicinamibacteria bacterium]
MSLSGSLATMQLGDLLQWCGSNLKTGTLRLKRGPIEKQLFFKEGRLFSSVSTSPRETLGQFLIRSGHITEEELFKALIEQDRTNQPLGRILVASELITEKVLEDILRIKTEESIYDCFLWKDGDFSFDDGKLPDQIPISLPLDLTGVILEGARRTDEWERIHEVFPTRLTTFDIEHEAVEAASDISDEDRRVLELVAREKNLAEISLELHERKLVRVRESQEEIDYDDQVKTLRDKLKEGVGLYNSGQYEKALDAFEEALTLDPQNKYARLFVLKIQRILEDLQNVADIPLDKVPRLKVTLVELAQLNLDPQEGFVISRVNGEWDVASITKICPMGEQEVLIIFKRLIDQGLIEFSD